MKRGRGQPAAPLCTTAPLFESHTMVPVVARHLQGLGVGAAGAEWRIAGIVSGQLSSVSLPGDRCPCPLHHQEGLELEQWCWVPAEPCCGPARCQGGGCTKPWATTKTPRQI